MLYNPRISLSASQRGNVLFLVLIAVALFAALAMAVTQSGRLGGANPSQEKTVIEAAQLAQIGAGLQTAALRMQTGGVDIDRIKLHDNSATPHTGNGSGSAGPCTSGETCLFAPEGGNALFPQLSADIAKTGQPNAWVNLFETGDDLVISGVADNQPVLAFVANSVNRKTCAQINKGLEISGIPQGPDIVAGNPITAAPGKTAACYQNAGDATQYYYYIVLAVP
jgi:hypothetical protein